jgi:general secretion pathway protein E
MAVLKFALAGGERLVLRILDQSSVLLNLASLGMSGPILSSFQELLGFTEGMILVTGPTGSGKTTTLYSAIASLDAKAHNIMTIEDPVEYKLPGISQMAVNPKINLTFASGLRHILRQDPDIILVGEIRDSETASIAVQAALTGHLVLSTLHTNDAPSAIPRLVDMNIEPYLLSSALIGVIAQRLVRVLCPSCKILGPPTPFEKKILGERGKKATISLFRAVGCPACQGIGFKGRLALYELMPLSPGIRNEMSTSLSSKDLLKVALAEGMLPLRQAGLNLIHQGLTTLEEVMNATRQ